MSMQLPISIAAAESPSAINLVVTGFLFVVVVLTLLAGMTWLGGKFFAARDAARPSLAKKTVKPPKPAAAAATAPAANNGDHLTAVITAAIHVALQDQRFRVRSIRRMAPGWAQEGRRQIFSSHRLR